MSMIMSHLQRKPGSCPRPDCTGMGIVSNSDSSILSWYDMHENISIYSLTRYSATCHLNFFSSPYNLDAAFRRVIVSEDDIARQQVEEDLRLYGSRPEPPDTVEVDESTQLANLPPRRNASDFEAAVDRPAKIRKKGKSHDFNYQTLTVMDWNSGTSPLDAWLNQSAVPSSTTVLSQQESINLESDLLAQEIDEIKVFRNVHMAIAPSPKCNDLEGLEFGAQIYYRNIMNRYPVIPTYLARRLAQANHDRAERLRKEKSGNSTWNISQKVVDGLASEIDLSEFFSPLTRPAPAQRNAASPPRPPSFGNGGPSPTRLDPIRPETPPPTPPPSSDFWTGGSPSRRPASAHARSSSMNSSLHGRPKFDPQEQNPTFTGDCPARTACDSRRSPDNYLPPPPIDLDDVLTFDCDICGQNIKVKTQYQWQ